MLTLSYDGGKRSTRNIKRSHDVTYNETRIKASRTTGCTV